MKIAIIGSRGIPNRYGGFEQLAEELSLGLLQKGHSVTVYNSDRHQYRKNSFKGVDIVHCYDAEHLLGTAGQFIYDLNCIRDARKKGFEVLLFLGYTSSSVWRRLFPSKSVIIFNMDGLEWKRSKYSGLVRAFLKYAEKLAVRFSDHLVADSPLIRDYLIKKYGVESRYIPYGAFIPAGIKKGLLKEFNCTAKNYYMLMGRMEPENNIATILEGFHRSRSEQKFIVLGNTNNSYGRYLVKRFGTDVRICFAGAIYDREINHALRSYCSLYFHGHSVGGTNPSLLEAMADGAMIAAHDNEFNRSVLGEDAHYFSSPDGVNKIIDTFKDDPLMTAHNLDKINTWYNWPAVIDQYNELFTTCHKSTRK